MCFGGGHHDNGQQFTDMILMNMLNQQQQTSAQATAQADAASRQAQDTIKADQGAVNSAFNSEFTPQYYQNYRDAYTNYYQPQLTDQYARAKDELTAALSQNGTLESTVGADALGNLAQREAQQEAAIQQQANAAVTALQGNVANQRTSLFNQANASVDPTQIASNAQAETTALAAPPSYTPLGQVFGDLVTPFQNYAKSAAAAPAQGMIIPQVQTANAYGGGGSTANPITG